MDELIILIPNLIAYRLAAEHKSFTLFVRQRQHIIYLVVKSS